MKSPWLRDTKMLLHTMYGHLGVGIEEVKLVKPDGKRERFLFQGEAFGFTPFFVINSAVSQFFNL